MQVKWMGSTAAGVTTALPAVPQVCLQGKSCQVYMVIQGDCLTPFEERVAKLKVEVAPKEETDNTYHHITTIQGDSGWLYTEGVRGKVIA